MRLNNKYITVIKDNFKRVFECGEIYLFGSRVDDLKKGGDIDLYLVLNDHNLLFEKKIRFLAGIKKELGEQKIDVIFNLDENRLVEQEAKKWGIKL
ncbi:MAG: nucleotidyltransferase domain-containing protein [Candidatus Muirbacterium halophilum]|nr:nucleotidyltransferase domain-containing protein [Candidatus Muirbacterium halophilum]MCK9476400.1 nucleotidyltransferase domain-containing protein [Candidatus Muirbacterium halophilum]